MTAQDDDRATSRAGDQATASGGDHTTRRSGGDRSAGINRRRLFGLGAAGVAGVAAVGAGTFATRAVLEGPRPAAAASISDPVPFYGEHQAGIVTPAQDRLHFAGFDVTTKKRAELTEHAAGVDRGRRADDPGQGRGHLRRRRRRDPRRRRTTPARRSACPRPG